MSPFHGMNEFAKSRYTIVTHTTDSSFQILNLKFTLSHYLQSTVEIRYV